MKLSAMNIIRTKQVQKPHQEEKISAYLNRGKNFAWLGLKKMPQPLPLHLQLKNYM